MHHKWITTENFSSLAGISRQAAWKACKRARWHGYQLKTSEVLGRGGAAGRQYLIQIDTLPPELQQRWKALQKPVEGRSAPALGSPVTRERTWWLHILGSALDHPKGSSERKAALDKIAAEKHLDWHGRRIKISLRTLQRKLERMEGEGSIDPLARSGRADRGRRRVILSRAWDGAVPFDDATKAKIAENLRQQIRGYVKKGAQPKEIKTLAARFLANETRAYGFRPNDPALMQRICRISGHMIHAERQYKKVYRHRFDRKASEDDRPRIKRTIRGMVPMEMVVMDVHPVDVLVQRSNGSTATARLLGFMDLATGRVWCELIFLDNRGGVRNVDLIEAFAGMAMHPAWGLPQTLYVDNGKEYLFADFLGDALELTVPSVAIDGSQRASRVIRALPYNASAKPIERWFGHFEQHYLRHCPGWIGGDRMNKKQQVIGKEMAPFGTFEAFEPYFFGLLKAYEVMPHTHGENKGRSPADVFAAHVTDGWAATIMDPENLLSVFTRPETRVVRGHAISVDGRVWNGPALDSYLGDHVTVRVPLWHGFNELAVIGEDGAELGIVRPEEEYQYHDARGAKRSASRVKQRNRAIGGLDRSAPDIDVAAELVAFAAEQSADVTNAPIGKVSVTSRPPAALITPEHRPSKSREDARREADEIFELRQRTIGRKAG